MEATRSDKDLLATATADQLVVEAVLYKMATIEGQNAVGEADGGKPVRDDEDRPSLGKSAYFAAWAFAL